MGLLKAGQDELTTQPLPVLKIPSLFAVMTLPRCPLVQESLGQMEMGQHLLLLAYDCHMNR